MHIHKPIECDEDLVPPTINLRSTPPAYFLSSEHAETWFTQNTIFSDDCAVQLIEAAARNRQAAESGHDNERQRRGGACPACGMAITRAVVVFNMPATCQATGSRRPGGNGNGSRR